MIISPAFERFGGSILSASTEIDSEEYNAIIKAMCYTWRTTNELPLQISFSFKDLMDILSIVVNSYMEHIKKEKIDSILPSLYIISEVTDIPWELCLCSSKFLPKKDLYLNEFFSITRIPICIQSNNPKLAENKKVAILLGLGRREYDHEISKK